MLHSNTFGQIWEVRRASSSLLHLQFISKCPQPAEESPQTRLMLRFSKIHSRLKSASASAAVPFVPKCLLHGHRHVHRLMHRKQDVTVPQWCGMQHNLSQQGEIWHVGELLCSKVQTRRCWGGGGLQRKQQHREQSDRNVSPTSLSGARIAVLEKCEGHGAGGAAAAPQTRGSSAAQTGTLENSRAFLGNLKSGLEAGVQQNRQQTAHFHVHRGCLGHPSL